MTPDAFKYVPNLRGMLTPTDESELRVTLDVLAVWDQRARDMGRPAEWRISEQQRQASRRATLGDAKTPQDLWIYGYGSLMWDPGFHFVEVRRADLDGYQRRFTSKATVGRGSPERPGLMLSLEAQPGCCTGLAFRIAADQADSESEILWRREMLLGSYCPAMLPLHTPQGSISAVVFASNHSHDGYAGDLSLSETAGMIARGSGIIGTNRDYLEQLAQRLAMLEIRDPYIEQLHEQVQGHAVDHV